MSARRHFSTTLAVLMTVATSVNAATPASETSFTEGQALMAAKKLPEAAQKFEAAVASDPGHAQAWYALAVVRRRMGECAPAIAAYRRYALLEPTKPEPYYGLGLCLRDTGDKAAAIETLKKYIALEKAPSAQKWVVNARETIAELGGGGGGGTAPAQESAAPAAPPPLPGAVDAGKAATTPDKAGKAGSPATGELADAQALRDRGRIDEAITKYQQAIAADPKRIAARAALGELLLQVHRDDEAIDVFRAALERNPSFPQALYDLAFALRVRERQAEAVDAYQRYIKLRPSDPDAYYGLARALQNLGRKADARKAYETYLSLEKRPSERRWIASAQTQLRAVQGAANKAP
ncbi:MAG TPA: tetratricopeptide repeat protein [Polyangia bacterium]|nr:tetratricopeptide repeat protein [Polyangia bacterium]